MNAGKLYSGSAGGSSFFSFGFVVFSKELLLWYFGAIPLYVDLPFFSNNELRVVLDYSTETPAGFSTVLLSIKNN